MIFLAEIMIVHQIGGCSHPLETSWNPVKNPSFITWGSSNVWDHQPDTSNTVLVYFVGMLNSGGVVPNPNWGTGIIHHFIGQCLGLTKEKWLGPVSMLTSAILQDNALKGREGGQVLLHTTHHGVPIHAGNGRSNELITRKPRNWSYDDPMVCPSHSFVPPLFKRHEKPRPNNME